MKVYNFKSVGQTQEQNKAEKLAQAPTPIGIKTPLQFGTTEGIFAMHFSLADQVHDNLKNLILTNWGERLGQYDFGANLRELTTELVSQDDFDTQAITRIKNAVGRWMSFVDLENFISEIDRTENQHTAIIKLTITYNVPALNVKGRKLQVVLYAI